MYICTYLYLNSKKRMQTKTASSTLNVYSVTVLTVSSKAGSMTSSSCAGSATFQL